MSFLRTCLYFFGREKTRKILDIVRGETDPESYESVASWVRQCYNRPWDSELKMSAINEILGGFGVEGVFSDSDMEPEFSYVNMGDTYDPTIVRYQGSFRVTSWGEMVEYLEAQGIEIP